MVRVLPKIQEYLSIGVEWIWIVDPREQSALLYSHKNPAGAVCDILRTENPKSKSP
jgi:Uma2 family endonuclease